MLYLILILNKWWLDYPYFFKKIEQQPHLNQFFSLFKIDFLKNFMFLRKAVASVRFALLLSSQGTRHPFLDMV